MKRLLATPTCPLTSPVADILIRTAEEQDKSLRSLRNTWNPFNTPVYKVFQQQRSASGKLRRQVDAGLNQLLTQYDISPEELAR